MASATDPCCTQSVAPARPSFSAIPVVLYGRVVPGWDVRRQLAVTVKRDVDGSFLAADPIFRVFGVGSSPSEALQDYVWALTEYYQILAPAQDAPTQALFRLLREYFRPADA